MSKITAYGALATVQSDDLLLAVDVHDTSMAATGTDKKMTVAQIGVYNVMPSGDTTGVADFAKINAITSVARGVARLQPGQYYINSQLVLAANAGITGGGSPGGAGNTILNQNTSGTAFTGASMILISGAPGCVLRDLLLTGVSPYSSNAAASGVLIQHSNGTIVTNVYANYINGWGVQVVSDATSDSYNTALTNIQTFQCAKGIQLDGTLSGDHQQATVMIGCGAGQCQVGDAIQITSTNDVLIWGLNGTCSAGTGVALNIENSAGVYISDVDLGVVPYTSNTAESVVTIGGTSNNVTIHGGIAEGGRPGIIVSGSSSSINIDGLDIAYNGTSGVAVSGTATQVSVINCQFGANGQQAGTNYELSWASTGKGLARGNWFSTPAGTGAGQVTQAVFQSAGSLYVDGNIINGAGLFAGGSGYTTRATNNIGYNPGGNTGPPAFPLTTVALVNPYGADATVYITAGTGGITNILVGGNTTGITLASGGKAAIFVPWGQSITVNYPSGTCTWIWMLS